MFIHKSGLKKITFVNTLREVATIDDQVCSHAKFCAHTLSTLRSHHWFRAPVRLLRFVHTPVVRFAHTQIVHVNVILYQQ